MHLDIKKMKRNSLSTLNVGLQFFIDQVSDFRKNLRIQKTLNASRRSSSKVFASSLLIVLILSAICDVTDACRSRTIYKPRTTQAPTTSPRPNITFHTYKCPEAYANWYCLNGATCFAVKIGMEVLYNCECKDGYIGPRCDYKDLDGSYLSARSRVMLETASIAGGAVAALLLACIVGIIVYLKKHTTKPCEFEVESQKPNHKNCNECQKF